MCLTISFSWQLLLALTDPLKLFCRRQKLFAVCIPRRKKVVVWVECVFFLQIYYNVLNTSVAKMVGVLLLRKSPFTVAICEGDALERCCKS